jgi:hypothetical protein
MQAQVQVTPARWWHIPGLSRLIRGTRRARDRGSGGALVWAPRWSPSLGVLQSVWPAPLPGVPGPQSFAAEQGGRPLGLAQMRPRREPRHWEVVYLAVEDAGPTTGQGVAADRTAARLLGELCDAAGHAGAERVFARIHEEGGRFAVFKQVGFSPVEREYTYYQEQERAAAPPAAAVPGLRPQRRADAFGLLQLYRAATPKVVQMAEGVGDDRRGRHWEAEGVDPVGRLTRRPRRLRWVVERDGRHVGWLQLDVHRRGPHRLRLMVDEGTTAHGDLTRPLLEHGLATLAVHPAPGVLVRVREHQQRLAAALEARGFYLVDDSLLMVKLLATPVPQRSQPQFAPALEKVV